ncbi:MAG: hypothetical protein ABI183_22780, partial [Polyangiaceae bacterium]
GGTQIMPQGFGPPQAQAVPAGSAQMSNNAFAGAGTQALQHQVGPVGVQPYATPVAVAAQTKSTGPIAFVVALVAVLVIGGGAVGFMMFRHGKATATAATATATATATAATATATATATSTPTSTAAASATSVSALPNASAAEAPVVPTSPPALTGHLPTTSPTTSPTTGPTTSPTTSPTSPQGHVAQVPSTPKTATPAPTPTPKPTSGRPITGDL